MLLAGLTVTATRSKKTAQTLADTKLEMEVISQCGSGGLEDYRPSRINMAKLKLEGQLDVVEYSRITVPESVHMGDPAGDYVEMLKARNSARGHLMAWSEKRAMQEYLKGLTENSNFNRREYGTVMSSEALENEMNLKDSEAYRRPTGSKYMVGSSSAPYCNSKYPTHMVVMDARTQQVLVDQLFSVPKCVRLARMSERSYDLLAKIFRAVPKRSESELQDVVGEEFMRLNEGNVSEFQKQKASGALPTEFPTIEEKDDLHRILMEVEPLLGASGYRTRRNIVRTHGEYPCHCLAQTLWYPKRGNLILVWDVEELYSTGLPDQNQQVSIMVVSAMLAVRWLEANADTSEQETAVPTPEQLSNVNMSRELDLFRTTCKVLRIPKAIERIWSRQRLMPWFRAVMTSWMYERAKRHMSRNTEAYQSFQLDIGPGAYKRAFLTHRNAVTTAVKRVAGAPCVTEDEKKEVLRADLERNVSLCLHNSFCRNREQKVSVDLLPCCKPRLLEQEGWGTARNSLDMLEKVLEDSDAEHQDGEMME